MKRAHKKQFTFHCDEEILEYIRQRSILTDRTMSAEINNILKNFISNQIEIDRRAIKMSDGTQKQN